MTGVVRTMIVTVALTTLSACASTAERQAEAAHRQKLVATHTQLGMSYLQRGQLEFAKENLEKALQIDPYNVVANNMMGMLKWRLKDMKQAEYHFRRAVDVEANDPDAHNNFGVFLCEQGRIDEAVKHFERAASNPLYQTPAEANLNAGVCLMKKPVPRLAEGYFREALRINPKLPGALYYMAKISYDQGNALAARGFMQRYFEAGPDTPEVLLLAVKVERTLRNKNEAASYALRLRGKFPDSDEAKELAGRRIGGAGR